MRAAARLAFDTVQERWKLTRNSFVQAESAAGRDGKAPASTGYMTGEVSSVLITAQFSGLKEWQAIRTRLAASAWGAELGSEVRQSEERHHLLRFPGRRGRLTAMASAQGLAIENSPDGLIVKTR